MFGQTSLFVYWIHVEIAYGVFTYAIHRSLPLAVSFPVYRSVHADAPRRARSSGSGALGGH